MKNAPTTLRLGFAGQSDKVLGGHCGSAAPEEVKSLIFFRSKPEEIKGIVGKLKCSKALV